jgi:F420 biosynthesis protein FbiB-like protein
MSFRIPGLIRGRRSVRKYSSKEVPRDILFNILEAARWAPSAHNAQPWRFIIITERSLKRKLAEHMADEWIKDMIRDGVPRDTREKLAEASIKQFTDAPVLIVACVTMEDMDKYPDGRRMTYERIMAVQSLAASIQNILLAAHSEGLGACWFCAPLFCQDAVRKVLRIPKGVEPQALITLGYPSEKPIPPPRKPLQKIVYMNYWGGKA